MSSIMAQTDFFFSEKENNKNSPQKKKKKKRKRKATSSWVLDQDEIIQAVLEGAMQY